MPSSQSTQRPAGQAPASPPKQGDPGHATTFSPVVEPSFRPSFRDCFNSSAPTFNGGAPAFSPIFRPMFDPSFENCFNVSRSKETGHKESDHNPESGIVLHSSKLQQAEPSRFQAHQQLDHQRMLAQRQAPAVIIATDQVFCSTKRT